MTNLHPRVVQKVAAGVKGTLKMEFKVISGISGIPSTKDVWKREEFKIQM